MCKVEWGASVFILCSGVLVLLFFFFFFFLGLNPENMYSVRNYRCITNHLDEHNSQVYQCLFKSNVIIAQSEN